LELVLPLEGVTIDIFLLGSKTCRPLMDTPPLPDNSVPFVI